METFDKALESFIDKVYGVSNSMYKKEEDVFSIKKNSKFIRVSVKTKFKTEYAFCFLDKEGNIYKAASWKVPAKGIRGNIFSTSNGTESLGTFGFIRYL